MRRLTYTNARGESISFYLSPFVIESLTGIGEVGADIQGQKSPYQDGDTYLDTLLGARYPVLEGSITTTNPTEIRQHRERLLKVCNPKYGLGRLVLELDGTTKEIYGVVDGVPTFPERGTNPYQRFMVAWKCPNPYWQDINPTNIKLEDFVPNFKFPFSFPVIFSIRGDTKVLINNGHAPTPVTVTFRGEAVNPKITNLETGEFIKVNRTIPIGYSLVITTEFNNKSVKILAPDGTETNAMGYIDLDSSFFSLDVGENRLSFITDGGRPEVYVEYRNLYIGV